MNAINVISPYKYFGMWVFDDKRVRPVMAIVPGGGGVGTFGPFMAGVGQRAMKNAPAAFSGAFWSGLRF
jgi:hypothetical protein